MVMVTVLLVLLFVLDLLSFEAGVVGLAAVVGRRRARPSAYISWRATQIESCRFHSLSAAVSMVALLMPRMVLDC